MERCWSSSWQFLQRTETGVYSQSALWCFTTVNASGKVSINRALLFKKIKEYVCCGKIPEHILSPARGHSLHTWGMGEAVPHLSCFYMNCRTFSSFRDVTWKILLLPLSARLERCSTATMENNRRHKLWWGRIILFPLFTKWKREKWMAASTDFQHRFQSSLQNLIGAHGEYVCLHLSWLRRGKERWT